MKLLSLSSKNNHHYAVPDMASTWPWPYCHQPRTLSFRDADPVFKTINSAFDTSGSPSFHVAAPSSEESPSFSTAPSELPDDQANDDADVESLIRGARSERRLFFEPSRGDTSSILADQRSMSNARANEDGCEANEGEGEDDPDDDDVEFKKEKVTLLAMESRDPYEDFRKSMEEMVEAHGIKSDDWPLLEELLCWYLRVNDRDNHGYIYGAFVDLLVHGDRRCRRRRRRRQCRLPGHHSPSSSLSLYNTSSPSLSSSSSSSSSSAPRVSASEAEETVSSESTPGSSSSSASSSGVSLEVVEDEGRHAS
ncbi:transcription repressor OFP13-like [Rhodamnia argentea]|uniref:Transcription repressor n=1 Tax=Rhodamnia argentea TaxID=178133 RepID=A0ABM3GSW1_9MYRT|nr:transcription repressor OFP13-like [Rhodamnia argentea]